MGALFDPLLGQLRSDVAGTFSGVLPVSSGGTGSATQNFVDLSSTQSSIGGAKNFTGYLTVKTSLLVTAANGTNVGVGIGTASPASTVANRLVLDMSDTSGSGVELRIRSTGGSSAATGRFFVTGAGAVGFGTDTNSPIQFFVNGGSSTIISISSTAVSLTDGINFIVGGTTGTKIGTNTGQKLSFWNKTPIIQPTTSIAAAAFTANTSGTLNDTATFGGYTIGQIAAALINVGILA